MFHLSGHKFTGPFTDVPERLLKPFENNNQGVPLNRLDWTSMEHDIRFNNNMAGREMADTKYLNELAIEDIEWPPKKIVRLKEVSPYDQSEVDFATAIIASRLRVSRLFAGAYDPVDEQLLVLGEELVDAYTSFLVSSGYSVNRNTGVVEYDEEFVDEYAAEEFQLYYNRLLKVVTDLKKGDPQSEFRAIDADEILDYVNSKSVYNLYRKDMYGNIINSPGDDDVLAAQRQYHRSVNYANDDDHDELGEYFSEDRPVSRAEIETIVDNRDAYYQAVIKADASGDAADLALDMTIKASDLERRFDAGELIRLSELESLFVTESVPKTPIVPIPTLDMQTSFLTHDDQDDVVGDVFEMPPKRGSTRAKIVPVMPSPGLSDSLDRTVSDTERDTRHNRMTANKRAKIVIQKTSPDQVGFRARHELIHRVVTSFVEENSEALRDSGVNAFSLEISVRKDLRDSTETVTESQIQTSVQNQFSRLSDSTLTVNEGGTPVQPGQSDTTETIFDDISFMQPATPITTRTPPFDDFKHDVPQPKFTHGYRTPIPPPPADKRAANNRGLQFETPVQQQTQRERTSNAEGLFNDELLSPVLPSGTPVVTGRMHGLPRNRGEISEGASPLYDSAPETPAPHLTEVDQGDRSADAKEPDVHNAEIPGATPTGADARAALTTCRDTARESRSHASSSSSSSSGGSGGGGGGGGDGKEDQDEKGDGGGDNAQGGANGGPPDDGGGGGGGGAPAGEEEPDDLPAGAFNSYSGNAGIGSGQPDPPGGNQEGRGIFLNAGGGTIDTVYKSTPDGDVFEKGQKSVRVGRAVLRAQFEVGQPEDVVPTKSQTIQDDAIFETWSYIPDSNADGLGATNLLKRLNRQNEMIRFGPSDLPFPGEFGFGVHHDMPHRPMQSSAVQMWDMPQYAVGAVLDRFVGAPRMATTAISSRVIDSRSSLFGDAHTALSSKLIAESQHTRTNLTSIYGPTTKRRGYINRPTVPRYRAKRVRPYLPFALDLPPVV